jgi:hypothetical protein
MTDIFGAVMTDHLRRKKEREPQEKGENQEPQKKSSIETFSLPLPEIEIIFLHPSDFLCCPALSDLICPKETQVRYQEIKEIPSTSFSGEMSRRERIVG